MLGRLLVEMVNVLEDEQELAHAARHILIQHSVQPPHQAMRAISNVLPMNGDVLLELEDKTCTVCLQDIESAQDVYMVEKCSHVFHQHCLDAWFKEKPQCPICRTRL